jgi:hypothetical protein
VNELEWPACRFGLGVHKKSETPSNEFSSPRYCWYFTCAPVYYQHPNLDRQQIYIAIPQFQFGPAGLLYDVRCSHRRLIFPLGSAAMILCALICQLIGCRSTRVRCPLHARSINPFSATASHLCARLLYIRACVLLDSLLRVKFASCNANFLRVLREESGRNSEESKQKGARKLAA